jgi:hypothetical protein
MNLNTNLKLPIAKHHESKIYYTAKQYQPTGRMRR